MASASITGIDHVALLVKDVESSLPYYTEELGFAIVGDEINAAAGVRLVYLDAGNVLLQLVSPIAPGALADALAAKGEGLHHICLKVPDIPAALVELAPDTAVPFGVGGRQRRTAFLPNRPNGLVIELIEEEAFGTDQTR